MGSHSFCTLHFGTRKWHHAWDSLACTLRLACFKQCSLTHAKCSVCACVHMSTCACMSLVCLKCMCVLGCMCLRCICVLWVHVCDWGASVCLVCNCACVYLVCNCVCVWLVCNCAHVCGWCALVHVGGWCACAYATKDEYVCIYIYVCMCIYLYIYGGTYMWVDQ